MKRPLLLPVVCSLAFLFFSTAFAEVEHVQLALSATESERHYDIPEGKVLMVEYVLFSREWEMRGVDKTIEFSLKPTGKGDAPIITMKRQFHTEMNPLPTPLRLQRGRFSLPAEDGSGLRCMVVGLLTDQDDVSKAVPSLGKAPDKRLEEAARTLAIPSSVARKASSPAEKATLRIPSPATTKVQTKAMVRVPEPNTLRKSGLVLHRIPAAKRR